SEVHPTSNAHPTASKNNNSEQKYSPGELFAPNPANDAPISGTGMPAPPTEPSVPRPAVGRSGNHPATVKRIVILYDDDTFEAYFPTMR
ncbi:MAG: hypothetical protein K2L09_02090, partial [Alistipes sp.]|nr:hypothetical protein [Alistipes sp.]